MYYPSVGVVIVTYNSEKFIQSCISSIILNKYPNLKIVVFDNASSDNTIPTMRRAFPKVHIIASTKNIGFGAGNNKAIKYLQNIKCAYITLINPDTKIKPDLIHKLVGVFSIDKKAGVAGPIITYMHETQKIWFAGGYFNNLFCYTKHPLMNKNINEQIVKSGRVNFITGACMMIKNDVIKKVGLLPEQYFLYFEDVFFCQKVIQSGFSCYLFAEALTSHDVSSSTGNPGTNKMTPLRAYYYARNPLLYIKTEIKGIQKVTNYIGQLFIRFPYYSLQFIKLRSANSFFSYINGIYDGLVR